MPDVQVSRDSRAALRRAMQKRHNSAADQRENTAHPTKTVHDMPNTHAIGLGTLLGAIAMIAKPANSM